MAVIEPITQWTETVARSGLRLLGILLVALILRRLLKLVTDRLVHLASSDSRIAQAHEQHTRTLASLLFSAGTGLIFAGALLTALAEFGINVTPVAAAAGLASLGLGLGTQHIIRDLVNGFLVVFEDQYGVGETIQVGDVTGRVEQLSLRRTVLRDPHGAIITLANGEIRHVANLSRDWAQAFVDVSIPKQMSTEKSLTVLDQVAAEMRADAQWGAALVDGPRVLGVETFGADGTTLRLQVRTAPLRQNDVARELRRRILERFEPPSAGAEKFPD